MKKKILLIILLSVVIITGCENKSTGSSKTSKKDITKIVSCHNEGFLFHSKKYVEHVLSLDKNNKLIEYEHIEKYYSFDDDDNFNMICEGSEEEEINNNKIYSHFKETADCDKEKKEVIISDVYDISQLSSNNQIPSDDIKNNMQEDYTIDIEEYQTTMTNKGYTCEEK